MKTFLLSLAGAFVAILLFIFLSFIFLAGLIGSAMSASEPAMPESIVLELDLNTEIPDQAPTTGLAAFNEMPGFIDLLTGLQAAETDDSVKGLYIRGAMIGVGSARAEELRTAIKSFQDSGKFVVAHSQGIFGTGPSAYRSISAADEIWVQQGTELATSGVSFETEFFKGLFDKIDLKPEVYPFYEYKNAANSYNEEAYTEPHREAMQDLATSLWNDSLTDIAADRGISVGELTQILESGPNTAETALQNGLIDNIGFPVDAVESVLEKAGEGAELLSMFAYTPPTPKGFIKRPAIAIVGGDGGIVTGGAEGDSPFSSGNGFASDAVSAAIIDAADDDKVKALVFRVNSPGGSPVASDQILNALERVQAAGKPVVVSMGSLAASGGYWVSAKADHIVANKSTITGSIGIFGGKFAIEGTMNKIGITFDEVTTGASFADAYGVDEFTPEQTAAIKTSLERGYKAFIDLVSDGRGMSYDQVHAIAKGRVWSGSDAKERGLVDTIGTFTDAIDVAKELAEIDADTDIRLKYFPRRKTGFEALEEIFGASAESAEAMATISTLTKDARIQSLIDELAVMESLQRGETRAMGPRIRER